MSVKCFDILDAVVQEATERFSPLFVLDTRYYDVLKNYCSIMDSLAEEFDGEAFEVEVDEIKMTVAIRLECGDITIKESTHRFYGLARQTLSFDFLANPETGNLIAEFIFPSVWKKAA